MKFWVELIFAIAAIVAATYVYHRIIKPDTTSSVYTSHSTFCSFKKLVLVRHGEKPADGLGNLDCQGLNRSLALPNVLLSKFGKPDFIFAPNPARKITDKQGQSFNYIRPLVTIEPTAIRCNLPINSDYGYTDTNGLLRELCLPKYKGKTIFVAWEHKNLDMFAKNLAYEMVRIDKFNGVPKIPEWNSNDFDSIFIFTRGGTGKYSFSIDHEGLNGMSKVCPI